MVKSDISRFFIALCNKGEGFSRNRYQLGSRKWAFEFSTETVDKFVENSLINGLTARLNGFYNVTRPLLQPMLLKKRGRIINVASLTGLKGMPGQTNYATAKGGLIAATKSLAQEVGRKKVTVNAIAPGFVKTDMVDGLDEATLKKDIPLQRFGEPEEVAALIGFLASPEAAYITGECISINGGLY